MADGLFENEGRYTIKEGSSVPSMLTCELYSFYLTHEGPLLNLHIFTIKKRPSKRVMGVEIQTNLFSVTGL